MLLKTSARVTATVTATTPTGNYKVRIIVYGIDNGTAFTNPTSSTFQLNAASSGGGGGGVLIVPPPEGAIDVSASVNSEGVFIKAIQATSPNQRVKMEIKKDTVAVTKTGEPVREITIAPMQAPPTPPANINRIGLTYDFGPDGATFNPPISLTFNYDPATLPEGADITQLTIAYWNEENGEWVDLTDIVVDPITQTISGLTSHFTPFAMMVPSAPAEFTASNLTLSASEITAGESVDITVSVANNGDLSDTYKLSLNINGTLDTLKYPEIKGHTSEDIVFTAAFEEAGSYTIDVNGLSATLNVAAAAVIEEPTAEEPEPVVTEPSPEPAPAPEPPAKEIVTTPTTINWWYIGGGIVVAIIIISLISMFVARRRNN